MTEKEPTSINLRTDHKNWMDEKSINRSELINELLEEYRNGGQRSERAAKEYRKQQLSVDVAKLQSELETKTSQLQRIENELNSIDNEKEQEREQVIQEAVETFTPSVNYRSKSTEQLIPDANHEDMQYYAKQTDMDAETFREIVVDRILTRENDE
jgi:hypothetical protein